MYWSKRTFATDMAVQRGILTPVAASSESRRKSVKPNWIKASKNHDDLVDINWGCYDDPM